MLNKRILAQRTPFRFFVCGWNNVYCMHSWLLFDAIRYNMNRTIRYDIRYNILQVKKR
jgi:hypothetical protein